ncbi:MAG: UDP-3-O-(3-hydroxymyristoyl)glucosamine N-acyltransferase [Candidatus Acidiferrales bacterium]
MPTAAELAKHLNCRLIGESVRISGVAAPETAGAEDLIYLDAPRQASRGAASAARCAIVAPGVELAGKTLIESSTPKLDFARAAALILTAPRIAQGIHARAVVAPTAKLGLGVRVGPFAVIEEDAVVGASSEVGAHCVIGRGARLGDRCRLYPRVTLYPGARIGANVIIHAGAVIGSDGFGYVPDSDGKYWKFPQTGEVEIGDDVEIGANTTIDRGSLGRTEVARGTKIDNLVQIGHNVRIGEHSVVAAQAGIAGSSVLGRRVVIGGQVGIADNCTIEDGAIVGAQGGVPSNKRLPGGRVYWGTPARPIEDILEQYAWLGRLPGLAERLKALEMKNSAD